MDTMGAVVGPFAPAALIVAFPYRALLWWTLVPGLLAAASMAFLVRERPRSELSRRPFFGALAALPVPFRRYLLAVGLFGLGDFAHSLLILRAIEILKPCLGDAGAAGAAMSPYGVHNVAGALLAFVFGAAGAGSGGSGR